MRRSTSYLAAFLTLSLLAAVRFFPDLKRWLAPDKRSIVPVAAPGTAPIEGPYFSDVDRVADRIIAATNQTRRSLHVAIYDLTQPDIAVALEAAHRRGVEVRVVADERQAQGPHSEVPYLVSRGVPVRLSRGYKGDRSVMHNKFAVFDSRLAVTGSFNWTISAERYNYENALFLSDPAVVARFEEAFDRIWSQAR